MSRVRYTSVWEKVNVRPADYSSKDNLGDCTTRCLTYILNGNYREIEARQYAIAEEFNRTKEHYNFNYYRNMNVVYSVIFRENGYSWIHLLKTKARGKIAEILSGYGKIATLSRNHICPIDNGKVIDIWDSTGGQVYGLCVKNEMVEKIRFVLDLNGIESECVFEIRHKANHHRRRYYW